ncbi:hypothetical protein Fcan01_05386 [Folsomia candida]|uniref:Uncharacterized protein n=1 Tax=Folsomia candida TaxID=158441 RepID=A0A226ERY0_FOLCA|nr:hypothetical protein Fcan01_05386 [Folsomia candida]
MLVCGGFGRACAIFHHHASSSVLIPGGNENEDDGHQLPTSNVIRGRGTSHQEVKYPSKSKRRVSKMKSNYNFYLTVVISQLVLVGVSASWQDGTQVKSSFRQGS